MIVGIGIDLVEVKRIKQLLSKHKSKISNIFTKSEIAYCKTKTKTYAESFAGRFAVKEAFMKAVGTGWGTKQSPNWTDIETVAIENKLKLSGKAKTLAKKLKVKKTHLSISHTKDHAIAVVILEE